LNAGKDNRRWPFAVSRSPNHRQQQALSAVRRSGNGYTSPPMFEAINDAVSFVRSKTKIQPEVGIVLGSGLGSVVDAVKVETTIPYAEIPGAKAATVIGHSGQMVL